MHSLGGFKNAFFSSSFLLSRLSLAAFSSNRQERSLTSLSIVFCCRSASCCSFTSGLSSFIWNCKLTVDLSLFCVVAFSCVCVLLFSHFVKGFSIGRLAEEHAVSYTVQINDRRYCMRRREGDSILKIEREGKGGER